jgi:Spy/CpxP family protein refolding chaperone
MSLRNKLAGACLSLGLILGFGAVAFAQQTQSTAPAATTQQQSERGQRRRGEGRRGHEMGGMMRLLHGLDLTDTQKQQARAITERFQTSTQTQREELFKLHDRNEQGTLSTEDQTRAEQLHKEMRASMKQMRTELLAILMPEQRAKMEQRKQELKLRRQERRGEGRAPEQNDNQ